VRSLSDLDGGVMADIRIIHGDCMDAMKEMPDKAFELAKEIR
jgi:DNA modification methylase